MTARKVEHNEDIIMELAFENEEPDGSTNYYAVAREYSEKIMQPLLDEIAGLEKNLATIDEIAGTQLRVNANIVRKTAERDRRIAELEAAASTVVVIGVGHNFNGGDVFEGAVDGLREVVEKKP